MKTQLKTLSVLTILASISSEASTLAIDARGDAMGGTGSYQLRILRHHFIIQRLWRSIDVTTTPGC